MIAAAHHPVGRRSSAMADITKRTGERLRRHREDGEEVLVALRVKMRDQLNASDEEVESLLGLVESQLGVTLHRVLKRSDSAPGDV